MKMATALVCVFLLTFQLTYAAPACVSCMLGCFQFAAVCVAAGPAGSTACFIFCETLCIASCFTPACLDARIPVLVQRESKAVLIPAKDVVVGDHVLTMENGQELWTRVIHSKLSTGNFSFINITAGATSVQVTPNHVMVVLDAKGGLQLCAASDLNIDDRLASLAYTTSTTSVISQLDGYAYTEKVTLVTKHGTMFAGEVLISTICESNLQFSRVDFDSTISQWRLVHNIAEGFQTAY